MKYDPNTMPVTVKGNKCSIIAIPTGHKILNGPKKGQDFYMAGVLVHKSGKIWRGKAYYADPWNCDETFVMDRFLKIESTYGP